jgi:hypothetical protein
MAWRLSLVPNGISGREALLMTTTIQLVLSNPGAGSSLVMRKLSPATPTHFFLRTSISASTRNTRSAPRAEAMGYISIRDSPLHLRALSTEAEKEVWIWDRDELEFFSNRLNFLLERAKSLLRCNGMRNTVTRVSNEYEWLLFLPNHDVTMEHEH